MRHRHGVRFGQFGREGLVQPAPELAQRVVVGMLLIQLGTFIAFAKIGKWLVHAGQYRQCDDSHPAIGTDPKRVDP
jgi:hypothetical protein